MNLRSITLHNYGLFRGEHKIDLTARPGKPIILFGGKNGAGKTTVLEALRLCLYGSSALGERISKDAYTSLLGQRIHNSPALLIQPSFASVMVAFEYADIGRIRTYEVARSWERTTSGRVSERLQVMRDGEELSDLTVEQWQDFVQELVPPGVSRLFFFDGEKIQHLAEDSSDQRELGMSVKALLGTDLIERLQADLSIHRTRIAKATRHANDGSEFDQLSKEVTECEKQVNHFEEQRGRTESNIAAIQASIARAEQRITAEGGAFSKSRDSLISRREEARARSATLEQSIRHLCQGVLPFAFAPRLCIQLRDHILQEEELQLLAAGDALLKKAKTTTIKKIESLCWLPPETGVSRKNATALATKLRELVEECHRAVISSSPNNGSNRRSLVLHELSTTEARQLLQWIQQALDEIPARLQEFATDLEAEYRNLQKAEEALKRIPADDVLAPLVTELQELNKLYGELSGRALTESEEIRTAQTRLTDVRRKLVAEAEKLSQEASDSGRVHMISKIQSALDEFRENLLSRKIQELEHTLTDCFNLLSRKTDAVKRVSINQKDFAVVLYDRDNNPLPKERLSAGEKQIYAIAMLWALARTSGRPLPVIIDTPLGRLDSDHRRLLVERYFPSASHQVIVLSTDTEVDTVYFEALRPFVASAYRLEYDMVDRCTTVKKGYFFEDKHEAYEAATH